MDGHLYTALFEAAGGQPVLKAYPDPITKNAPWTIGIGCTGPDIHEGTEWTVEQAWSRFYDAYAIAYTEATQSVGTSCWAGLNEQRRAVLTDMAFQMGGAGLDAFQHMLAAMRAGQWQDAADHMLDSAYAKQTPSRAKTNAQTLLTGEWPAEA